jgi:hypothetical protein
MLCLVKAIDEHERHASGTLVRAVRVLVAGAYMMLMDKD